MQPNDILEIELDYPDIQNEKAHGQDQLKSFRQRKASQLLREVVREPRYRRSSHDPTSKERRFLIDVEKTLKEILLQEDTDRNCQITIQDLGPKSFNVPTLDSEGFKTYEIRGNYQISNLLQELALASEVGRKQIILSESRLTENPVDRISRLIKDGLTRRIDASGLENIYQRNRIYIPFDDDLAWTYFNAVAKERPHLELDVVKLPKEITPIFVKSLNIHPGILSLGLRQVEENKKIIIKGTPFVVPGGRFNEMYGWDSYFETLGLLQDGRLELARGMVENFCYEIEHYGKILNANRSYYLTRSQPPFLTDMVIQTHKVMTYKQLWETTKLEQWLACGIRASIKELFSVWLNFPRLDYNTGLSKYHPEGIGIPPETEVSHFDAVLGPFAEKHSITIAEFIEKYNTGSILEPELDEYFIHDRAVRESGHDTTYRFEGRCANLATVDLNSLLYKYEIDIAKTCDRYFGKKISLLVRRGKDDVYLNGFLAWKELNDRDIHLNSEWNCNWAKAIMIYESGNLEAVDDDQLIAYKVDQEEFHVHLSTKLFKRLAEITKENINKYLWCPKTHLFYDWDCKQNEQSTYQTVTALWPLWAEICDKSQALLLVSSALAKFEKVGGLVSGTEVSRGEISLSRPNRQWDYPYGWAPHQILAWKGLELYGFHHEQERITYRWLFTIIKAFVDFNGVIPEKFDVVSMSHQLKVEYGNVGTDFKYVVKEGFGWMNASVVIGLHSLKPSLQRALGALTHPDKLFPSTGQ